MSFVLCIVFKSSKHNIASIYDGFGNAFYHYSFKKWQISTYKIEKHNVFLPEEISEIIPEENNEEITAKAPEKIFNESWSSFKRNLSKKESKNP